SNCSSQSDRSRLDDLRPAQALYRLEVSVDDVAPGADQEDSVLPTVRLDRLPTEVGAGRIHGQLARRLKTERPLELARGHSRVRQEPRHAGRVGEHKSHLGAP